MIVTVTDSALMRDKKMVIRVGDLVRLEMNKNVWQVVAISGEYEKERNIEGQLVEAKKYRKYMVRKLFNAKGVFKPSPYAECVHQGWANKPRKDKLDEFERYFEEHPEDRAVAYDLAGVIPDVWGSVYCRANFNGADVKTVLSQLRTEIGYSVCAEDIERVISNWVKRGKMEINRGSPFDDELKHKYPYRIFACGYEGYYDENTDALFETVGIDLSAEEKYYCLNVDNARKALKEAGRENNGTHYVFR